MGRGSYTAADWASLRSSRQLNSDRAVENMFGLHKAEQQNKSCHISLRNSCDPDLVSEATPIVIGFDATASMGYLAKELATNSVHRTVMQLLSQKPISSPQIMCAAIGDCKSDESPLQVTQFEADIRIIRQLLDLYLEGGGGGNDGESYNLLWYFAAYHTKHDCFEKRHKKGYLFTIGDDRCHSGLNAAEIRANFSNPLPYAISNEELLAKVRETYHVFHIHIEKDAQPNEKVFNDWQRLMPGCCAPINAKDIDCLSELITTVIAVTEGQSRNAALKLLDQKKAERIARSVSFIAPPEKNDVISF